LGVAHAGELLNLSGESFLRAAYVSILGRPIDEDGLASYTAQLRLGVEPSTLLVALARSREAAERRAPAVPGLFELVREIEARPVSKWGMRLQRRLAPLLQSVFLRLDVLEDSTRRAVRQLELESERLNLLQARLAALSNEALLEGPDQPRRAPAAILSESERGELSRMGREGRAAYHRLRATIARRESVTAP
jgi:hypothetical protein